MGRACTAQGVGLAGPGAVLSDDGAAGHPGLGPEMVHMGVAESNIILLPHRSLSSRAVMIKHPPSA